MAPRDLSDVPLPNNNPPPPDWVVEGVRVVHDSFGPGVVRRVGLYKRTYSVWVEFDGPAGDKALMPLYAMPHMRPESSPGTDSDA